jgi:hypothetical protein
MAEPQIPGSLQGNPTEGTWRHVQPNEQPGYVEGPTPSQPGYAPPGNPLVNQTVTAQRPLWLHTYRGEWGW